MSRKMLIRRLALVAVVLVVVIPLPGIASAEPYDDDPNGLVPFKESVHGVYTTGVDEWEVWICDVPDWGAQPNLSQTVAELNSVLNPYFDWLSDGIYSTSFVAGGTVTSGDVITQRDLDALDQPFAPDCEAEVAEASTSDPNGALIIVDVPTVQGYATGGAVCPELPFTGCVDTYPSNSRRAVVGAATVETVPPLNEPHWLTVAHEIGHTLAWPHSYGGLTVNPETSAVSAYDNPMDLMSGAIHRGLPVGTIAYNRYAAGWIDPGNVSVHRSGSRVYDLAPIGGNGIDMIVIPTEAEGHFFAIGARRRSSYDEKLPAAGVEIYEIEQRREVACILPESWPSTWPCFSTLVRVSQEPPVPGLDGTAHVLGIDDEQAIGGFTITVLSAGSSAFSVRVSERGSGRFLDDDGNLHEANIEAIAEAGITQGCNQAGDLFCPGRDVTRGEMAAFLIRAMGLESSLIPYQGTFPDVGEQDWYAPYVETLANQGVATGFPDGTYRPLESVSRAEMAVFLVRAFGPVPVPEAEGIFTDVPLTAWYADAAEEIFNQGTTRGCKTNPLSYCPLEPVLRDQMASFIARTLDIGN
jgi:hypothetical protein